MKLACITPLALASLGLMAAPVLAAPSQDRDEGSTIEKSAEAGDKQKEVPGTSAPAPTGPRRRAAPPETFEAGLSEFYGEDYAQAAAAMYDYVATNEPTAPNYEWGEYFLGVSLQRLGFSHAAAEYLFNVAKNRSRPEILPEALAAIEEIMRGPHDERLLEAKLLVDSEFGYLPGRVQDFVRYHKGLTDLRDNRIVWAERQFDGISEESEYQAKAIYALAVQRLKGNRVSDAVRGFRRALRHPKADRLVRNDARLALARVLYENERYAAADKLYATVEVPELTTAEASLFLERAWTAYWRRDFRRTMGILYALEAPSYSDYFAPERYLLQALLYKNLCHYIPAKRAIRRFRFRYDRTLENIRERIDLRDDEVLRQAALSRGEVGRLAAFRRALTDEADRIDTIGGTWVEVGLDEQLREVYRLTSEGVDLRLAAKLERAVRAIAEELVEFEEQMYLLDYEIGLAIYRRLRKEEARRPTDEDNLTIPAGGDRAYFAFDEEFWNDELPDYDFFVENRCFDEGPTD